MKLMIASDIHGSAFYCEQMIEAYKREGADKLLLLGDILYHGPRNASTEQITWMIINRITTCVSDQL